MVTIGTRTLRVTAICALLACGGGGATKSITGGGGGNADLVEDFSTYSSTSNMLADPRGIYSTGEDVETAQMVLDQAVGYGTSSQSMRFDFPARDSICTDYTIGRNINLPSDQSDVYLEVVAKFQSGWTTVMPGCSSSNPDYKFLFGRVRTTGRFNVMVGTSSGLTYTVGYPAGEDNFEGGSAGPLFDGQWHTYRFHMKVGASGACKLWVDGVVVKDYGTVSMAANEIYGIALGRNINQGPATPQSMWWGKVSIWYTSNPGW